MKRSTQLRRPTARVKKTGPRKRNFRKALEQDEGTTNDLHPEASAMQRVNDFMLQLTTPSTGRQTKKVKFASKSKTVQDANKQLLGQKKERETVKSKEINKKQISSKNTSISSKRHHNNNHNGDGNPTRTRQRVPNNVSTSEKSVGGVFKAPKPKAPTNGINSKLPKTSIARPNHNGNQGRLMRNHTKSKSNSSKSSLSPQDQSQQQPVIDQYSLSLQIKNSECESLKNENKELKERNKALVEMEKEHRFCKRDILNLHEETRLKDDRIGKLERKLESCGIDSIALQSPAFMNEDTQKHIIFWRERLCKARERMNDRKLKQKQMIETAQYYIKQLAA